MSDIAASPLPPAGPAHGTVSPWRQGITTFFVCCLLALGVVAACSETQEPEGKTVAQQREESETLSDADRRGKLRIAVWGDVPKISYHNSRTGGYEGFDIEIAKAMAGELGFRESLIEWVAIGDLPDRGAILGNDQADMVVASFSMTKSRDDIAFAGPYLIIPQAVLVHRARKKPLETIPDLRAKGVAVCTTTGSTSAEALRKNKIEIQLRDNNAQCMAGMREGLYDAFSTDRHILAGFERAEEDRSDDNTYEILDTAIADADEKLGIAVPKDDEAMRALVAYFLDRWKRTEEEGGNPWLSAFDSTIGSALPKTFRSQPDVSGVPDLVDHDSRAPQG